MKCVQKQFSSERWRVAFLPLFFCVFAFVLAYVGAAHAAAVCTDDTGGDFGAGKDATKVISDVATNITSILNGLSKQMFTGVATGISSTVSKMVQLYILIYGLLFMFGSLPITVYEFVRRLVKASIVAMLLGTQSTELYTWLANVFDSGSDEIINVVISAMFDGKVSGGGAAGPLAAMDTMVSTIISPRTIVTISAIAMTGFHGFFIFLIIGSSLKSIAEAILNAMWVYLMAKVVRTLLLGLAPLFIACALYDQTRSYFQGWMNQLVNTALQPIFLFAFFAFFVTILDSVINKIIDGAPVCITQLSDAGKGSPSDAKAWRFKVQRDGKWEEYKYMWGPEGPLKDPSKPDDKPPPFPIDIFSVAVFYILAELASRMNSIAVALANGVSQTSTNFAAMSGVMGNSPPSGKGGGGGDEPPAGSGKSQEAADQQRSAIGKRTSPG